MHKRYWGSLAMILVALPAMAQQVGTLTGKVTGKAGRALAGIHVDATSSVLPQARRVVTNDQGEYHLAFLPPGDYTLTFTHPAQATEKRKAGVALSQTTTLNVTMNEAATASAVVEVVAQATMADATSAELKTSIGAEVLTAMPVGLGYRDIIKLIPGVAYTQDGVRDPNAGGSGQDNVHLMDGVNVNLPMYGTLAAAPASYDIEQVAITKGGASATDFNRSAGFLMNSISKSGTNVYSGEVSVVDVPGNLVARRPANSTTQFEDSTFYRIANIGGPIIKERLFFFASYFGPTDTHQNSSNLYGPVPEYSAKRNEFFGKLTYSATTDILIHASYRNSDETDLNTSVASNSPASTADGSKAQMAITTIEASWAVTPNNFLNFKFTNFGNYTSDHPNYLSPVHPALDGSVGLDVTNLASQGALTLPTVAQAGTNASILALINTYGYPGTGSAATPQGFIGGGSVGGYSSINTDNFFRKNYQFTWDGTFSTGGMTHDLHAGYQWFKEMEDLYRISNGWGSITINFANSKIPTSATTPGIAGLPYAYTASVYQQGIGQAPLIHSEYASQNFEFNDKMRWQKFTFNAGVIFSDDKLYGQGIKDDPTTASGYSLAPGQKYLEHEIKWQDTMQPRLGVTWNYQKDDTIYANYGRYVPSVSSLPRAASWARNLVGTVNTYFDATGKYIGQGADAVSMGKLFVPGIKPRHTDEFLIGTTKDFGNGITSRLYARYRESLNFWEDTPNNSRVVYQPPSNIPQTLYIPNLATLLSNLGGGGTAMNGNTSAVIAQLDGGFTKFYEVATENEWRHGNLFASFSYSWSHYYGNFDQDDSSNGSANDSNIFVGSSNIADSAGTQLWNNKYGNLSGDQRHKAKLFGSYAFPWDGKLGVYAIYQSGLHWQAESYLPYKALILATGSTSTSDTARYAEPAGSRVMPTHYQVDLNYAQSFWKKGPMGFSGTVDLYNVFNRQTPFAYNQSVNGGQFGVVQAYMSPRRTQLALKFTF
jgi:hypothetical protein